MLKALNSHKLQKKIKQFYRKIMLFWALAYTSQCKKAVGLKHILCASKQLKIQIPHYFNKHILVK